MLNNIFLSFNMLKLKWRARGVAMTEYAILLAFIAAIAVVAFSQGYDIYPVEDGTGNDKFVGNNLISSVWAAVWNTFSVISRLLAK